MKIAVAGAGIYGATAAIRLAEQGHKVFLFDPLGMLQAASAINACRVHAGYHYPRSPETIAEVMEAQADFLAEFSPAIVRNSRNYYAVPRMGSRMSADQYENAMAQSGLTLQSCRPDWLNFEFIQACYQVSEHLYDPDTLRSIIAARVRLLGISFEQKAFTSEMREDYDFVVWATYGLGPSRRFFRSVKIQVAENLSRATSNSARLGCSNC